MPNLTFLAGSKALTRLRRDGLGPELFKVVAGASGAAKWLVLSQLDRVIFGDFFQGRRDPLFLLGSSIGSWRFAAVSQKDPLKSIADLEEAYINQTYSAKPTAQEVTQRSREILKAFMPPEGLQEIMAHPSHRLTFLAVRSRLLTVSEQKLALSLGLAGAALGNLFSPGALKLFFERSLFFDSRDLPPYLQVPGFPSQAVALTEENLQHALLASGSIPLVMQGIRDIAGARSGIYRDGGIVDYHLNVPFLAEDDDQLVLFPHFEGRIVPGWFDKRLTWRRPHKDRMAPVLVVAPSAEFIARLPFGKIPDRSDFLAFRGKDQDRFRYWRKVTDECRRLADEFQDVVSKGLIADRIQALNY